MNRDRRATKGLDDAAPIAQRRGCLMKVEYGPESVCDFLIRTVELVIFVRVVRIEKIVASVSEIGHECRAIIAELRLFPQSPQIRLELWAYNKHGTYRYFRLTATGLEEIRQSGEPETVATGEGADQQKAGEAGGTSGEGLSLKFSRWGCFSGFDDDVSHPG